MITIVILVTIGNEDCMKERWSVLGSGGINIGGIAEVVRDVEGITLEREGLKLDWFARREEELGLVEERLNLGGRKEENLVGVDTSEDRKDVSILHRIGIRGIKDSTNAIIILDREVGIRLYHTNIIVEEVSCNKKEKGPHPQGE